MKLCFSEYYIILHFLIFHNAILNFTVRLAYIGEGVHCKSGTVFQIIDFF